MLASKKISLGAISENLEIDQTIVKNEDRGIVSSYEAYILKKTVEADNIICRAHDTAKQIARETRDEAETEFWKYAQAFYQDLEAIKASIIEEVEEQCRDVVVASLTTLLDSVPDEEKIRPLIKSLLTNRIDSEIATVFVNPVQAEVVEGISSALSIPVKVDEQLETDTVVLKTEKNEYKTSFKGKLNLLLRAIEQD